MFVKAIEIATSFTRPFTSISRVYGEQNAEPGCATFIIVNNEGWILTCKHVANQVAIADQVNKQYFNYKSEISLLNKGDRHYKSRVKEIEKKYGYSKGKGILIQQKNMFVNVVDKMTGFKIFEHPKYDVALIRLDGFSKILCDTFPVFANDSSGLKQGKSLCRLGYPYPEFTNYEYSEKLDDIVWTNTGRNQTPLFPIDGIMTRNCMDDSRIVEIELSTPGLRGQSGGPLFDVNGVIYGMQSATLTLPLGFDQESRVIKVKGVDKKVNDYSFIHLGRCVHVDILKSFMDSLGVKYQVG